MAQPPNFTVLERSVEPVRRDALSGRRLHTRPVGHSIAPVFPSPPWSVRNPNLPSSHCPLWKCIVFGTGSLACFSHLPFRASPLPFGARIGHSIKFGYWIYITSPSSQTLGFPRSGAIVQGWCTPKHIAASQQPGAIDVIICRGNLKG
jgi:hypothetical protein